jgi:hypothetical protein
MERADQNPKHSGRTGQRERRRRAGALAERSGRRGGVGPHGAPSSTPEIGSGNHRPAQALGPSKPSWKTSTASARPVGLNKTPTNPSTRSATTPPTPCAARRQAPQTRLGVRHGGRAYQSPNRLWLINLNGTVVATTRPPWRPAPWMPPVRSVGKPCAGKSHARFDVGGEETGPVGQTAPPPARAERGEAPGRPEQRGA